MGTSIDCHQAEVRLRHALALVRADEGSNVIDLVHDLV
jgi:hypothetical protein